MTEQAPPPLTPVDEALYHAKRSGRKRLAVHDGKLVRDSVDPGTDPDPTHQPVRADIQTLDDLDPLIPAN